ncbi:DUF669 domain-containing protein [Lysobacter enzymogenes]|uniref:DUF669 domain-containing protein n=1 Tax=Lysobacter enzymogenes TaxID=69 RepID=UPI001A95A711|nr:DUF669 domain-containing protein [Lysobacter enzymogenes]QQP96472.1 DUF669 domain-containing protein [Lysobacter enzymogenes]QQP96506.1 DUF669 domain-containing protein [Lysobacter enzymogenes]
MANLTGAYDPNAEAQQDFAPIPTADYLARIVESDMKPTSGNTGHYLELVEEIMEGEYKGRKLWIRLNLDNPNEKTVEIANRQFASIREATGVANPRDSQELHNKPHMIRVEFYPAGSEIIYGSKKGQKRDRDTNEVKSWRKPEVGSGNVNPSASSTPSPTPAPSDNAPWLRNKAA